VLSGVEFSHQAGLVIRNAASFKQATSTADSPPKLEFDVTIKTTRIPQTVDALELSVARRALKALQGYQLGDADAFGAVCVSANGLVKPGENGMVRFLMPARELLALDIQPRNEMRYAGIMLEHQENMVPDVDGDERIDVERFTLLSPVVLRWHLGRKALVGQEISQKACVLEMRLPQLQEARFKASLSVPRDFRLLGVERAVVRVAPVGQKLVGRAIIRDKPKEGGR